MIKTFQEVNAIQHPTQQDLVIHGAALEMPPIRQDLFMQLRLQDLRRLPVKAFIVKINTPEEQGITIFHQVIAQEMVFRMIQQPLVLGHEGRIDFCCVRPPTRSQ